MIYLALTGLTLAVLIVVGVVLRMRDEARDRESTEDEIEAACEGALILELSDLEFTRVGK